MLMRPKCKTPIQLFVSQKVREIREELALTQEQFAEKINCSRGYFADRENPNTGIAFNLESINTIAKVFNVSPQFFIPKKAL